MSDSKMETAYRRGFEDGFIGAVSEASDVPPLYRASYLEGLRDGRASKTASAKKRVRREQEQHPHA